MCHSSLVTDHKLRLQNILACCCYPSLKVVQSPFFSHARTEHVLNDTLATVLGTFLHARSYGVPSRHENTRVVKRHLEEFLFAWVHEKHDAGSLMGLPKQVSPFHYI